MAAENGKKKKATYIKEIAPIEAKFTLSVEECKKKWESLTPREKQVAALMAVGTSNEQVAAALGVSPKTNDIFRGNVVEKFGVEAVVGIPAIVMLAHDAGKAFKIKV